MSIFVFTLQGIMAGGGNQLKQKENIYENLDY